ncbi:hypothetical protein F4802DRAFT_619414 [Xylaria palmicola]|nr:hypothetical protein F4802DRAFT_619414 [Xylaria palmicola]
MALARPLTALTYLYVVAHADAQRFQTGSNAGDWTPVTPTAQHVTLSVDEWVPKTTSAPDRRLSEWELRRRADSSSSVCGYSADNLDGPAVTCDSGESCRLDRVLGIVGCCTGTNPRACIVPTTCLESSESARWSGDPLTTYCGNSDRPHCVTHSYDANFYDPLYGAYFIGCAARAASGDIVANPGSETGPGDSISLSTYTTTDGITTTTVTVSIPAGNGSSTAVPGSAGSAGSRNVGAIAGGVVGGVAGLALIVAAVFFFLHRRRKRLQAAEPLPYAFGRKMPPSDHDMYQNEPIPGSQYPSTFYGEAPPGMVQTSEQPIMGYPPHAYGVQNAPYAAPAGSHHQSAEIAPYQPPRVVPPKPQDEAVSPLDDSPVSPVSPAENYHTMVSALSNESPPLQPLQPAVHRQQPEYAQYSPPPPEQYQSYHPYPGT